MMTPMGKNFRAPKHADLEAWQVTEQLARHGFVHDHYTGIKHPTKLKDVPTFLGQHPTKSKGERLLETLTERNKR
jgi:hypothetical protein